MCSIPPCAVSNSKWCVDWSTDGVCHHFNTSSVTVTIRFRLEPNDNRHTLSFVVDSQRKITNKPHSRTKLQKFLEIDSKNQERKGDGIDAKW